MGASAFLIILGLVWMLLLMGANEAAGVGALLVLMGVAFLVVSVFERGRPSPPVQ